MRRRGNHRRGEVHDSTTLETDVVRFVAIVGILLIVVFALVQSLPYRPETNEESPIDAQAARERLEQATGELTMARQQLAVEQERRSAAESGAEEIRQRVETARREANTLAEQLRRERAARRNDRESLEDRALLEQRAAEAERRAAGLEEARRADRQKLVSLEQAREAAARRDADARAERARLQSEATSARQQRGELSAALSRARSELEAARAARQAAATELASLQQELQRAVPTPTVDPDPRPRPDPPAEPVAVAAAPEPTAPEPAPASGAGRSLVLRFRDDSVYLDLLERGKIQSYVRVPEHDLIYRVRRATREGLQFSLIYALGDGGKIYRIPNPMVPGVFREQARLFDDQLAGDGLEFLVTLSDRIGREVDRLEAGGRVGTYDILPDETVVPAVSR